MDPSLWTSPLNHGLILIAAVTSFGLLATSRDTTKILARTWPIPATLVLMLVSAAWSNDRLLTLVHWKSLLTAIALGYAIAIALPAPLALRVVLRAIGYTCILSVLFALFVPSLGVHQASDLVQAVHAGLWRGVLAHKVNLGVFAGTALPLLLYYRDVFANTLVWAASVVSSLACLIMAGSVTGVLGACFLSAFLLALGRKMNAHDRSTVTFVCIALVAIFFAGMMSGLFMRFATLLGRSTDMTGRTEMWPATLAVTQSSVLGILLGHGYVAGFKSFVAPRIVGVVGFEPSDAHNGFIETIVSVGWLGAAFVFWSLLWMVVRSRQLILESPMSVARIAALPLSFLLVSLFLNYSEALLWSNTSLMTFLLPLLATWITAPRPATRQRPTLAP